MALGGILAALAMVVMSLGTLIPIAGYSCAMLVMVMLQVVLKTCGQRTAWAWYGAVAILSCLMAPDKEAAAVFVALGYYPIVKPKLDASRGKWIWKFLLFNGCTIALYWILLRVIGLEQVVRDFADSGFWLTVLTLALGNLCFYLLDLVLGRMAFRRRK